MKKEKMTLDKLGELVEKLAIFTVNGFEKIEKDIGGLKTDMATVKATVSETDDRMRKLEKSVFRIESEMITPIDIEDLLGRVSYIERKLGIESGKRG